MNFGQNLLVFLSVSGLLLSSVTLTGNLFASTSNQSNITGTDQKLNTTLVGRGGGCLEGTGPFTTKACIPCDPIQPTEGPVCNIGGGLGAYFPMPVLKRDLNGSTGKLDDLSLEELLTVLHFTPEKELISIAKKSENSSVVERLIPLIVQSRVTPKNLANTVDALCDMISSKGCPGVEGGSGGGTAEIGPIAACALNPNCVSIVLGLAASGIAAAINAAFADPVYSCIKDPRYPDADLVCAWR